MQQTEQTLAWVADDWPNDFDFRAEVAEQQELLERTDAIRVAEERTSATHRFEYDF
ncbi:hypothetical protein GCM10011348_28220 [Marinobacterium nitratireducens]|uniref:Uncharacterized protein n=1 Tax=Marinobacterium nitratireducens TaxID=518897 RepID=A0A917ZKZ1_9GAMM|nr:hypothetical protein [Marinobacterium nitratireducens]GGO83747.1 hypothetical protein GCM10011348_28220 [Marinobacterium nitratireducens]